MTESTQAQAQEVSRLLGIILKQVVQVVKNGLRELGWWIHEKVTLLSWAFLRIFDKSTVDGVILVDWVLEQRPFTPEAKTWLRTFVRADVGNLGKQTGGGWFYPALGRVFCYTGQHEAMLHELAHAWYQPRKPRLRKQMLAATLRAAGDTTVRYQGACKLAHGYVYGVGRWDGLMDDENHWEMFAGFASYCMGNLEVLPPYLRKLYVGLFYDWRAS
ncbi:MAG: hypothetical protein KAY24_00025 [Candidatus Eisenbacteria sp.]|nr:hypothetical protein [Candidatus Eisenbacteria bacterium]